MPVSVITKKLPPNTPVPINHVEGYFMIKNNHNPNQICPLQIINNSAFDIDCELLGTNNCIQAPPVGAPLLTNIQGDSVRVFRIKPTAGGGQAMDISFNHTSPLQDIVLKVWKI